MLKTSVGGSHSWLQRTGLSGATWVLLGCAGSLLQGPWCSVSLGCPVLSYDLPRSVGVEGGCSQSLVTESRGAVLGGLGVRVLCRVVRWDGQRCSEPVSGLEALRVAGRQRGK